MPPQRGQGQWALGHREPLNPNERVKRDDDGLNARQRIIDRYQYTGFDSIDPADLRGRFRWLGLYTQRAPGIPGGRTAVLEPEELEDRYFMLRVRIDGGTLSSEQLTAIAGIATEFGRDVADVTDRQNVQLHWIRIEDVPGDLAPARGGRPGHHRGLRRHPAGHPRLPAGRRGQGRGAGRDAGAAGGPRPLHRRPGVLQPAPQVQVVDLRLRAALHQPRDQRRLVRRRDRPGRRRPASTSGSAAGCPPTRSSASGWARSSSRTGSPRCGPGSPRCSASTATAGPASTRG